jgi:hypothetical protein
LPLWAHVTVPLKLPFRADMLSPKQPPHDTFPFTVEHVAEPPRSVK